MISFGPNASVASLYPICMSSPWGSGELSSLRGRPRRARRGQWSRSAETSWSLFMHERPLMPISRARLSSSCLVHSS
jgi:hypothetical protein